jgi:hypothetical protein
MIYQSFLSQTNLFEFVICAFLLEGELESGFPVAAFSAAALQ